MDLGKFGPAVVEIITHQRFPLPTPRVLLISTVYTSGFRQVDVSSSVNVHHQDVSTWARERKNNNKTKQKRSNYIRVHACGAWVPQRKATAGTTKRVWDSQSHIVLHAFYCLFFATS